MPDDDDPETEVARLERLTDEELLAEAAAEGVDVPAEGARVRGLLTDAVRQAKAAREPTTALRELFLIERITGVPVGPAPDLDCWSPALPTALALAVSPPAPSAAIAEAIARQSAPPVLLVVDRPKAVEPPIDVEIALPVAVGRFRGDGCSPMCRLLDGPDRRRGLPLKCICGRYP